MNRAARVKDQEASGLSVVEYCRKVGIRPNNFYNWRIKERKAEPRFARVESESRVSIELEGGLKLKVAVGDLKSVLAALR
jgi:transposase-like protein